MRNVFYPLILGFLAILGWLINCIIFFRIWFSGTEIHVLKIDFINEHLIEFWALPLVFILSIIFTILGVRKIDRGV